MIPIVESTFPTIEDDMPTSHVASPTTDMVPWKVNNIRSTHMLTIHYRGLDPMMIVERLSACLPSEMVAESKSTLQTFT